MDRDVNSRFSFNTDVLPERDRFPAFYEGILRHVAGLDLERLGDAPFSATLDIRRAGAVCIAEIAVTAAKMMRPPERVADGDDSFVIQLWQQGTGGLTQGRQQCLVGPRQGLVIDNGRPATLRADAPSRFGVLTIPRSNLVALAPDAAKAGGTKLPDSMAFRLLSGYLREISSSDLDDRLIAQMVGDHILDLAALAISANPRELIERRGVRAARRAAILRTIERNIGDLSLSPTTVAQSLGITPRYLHILLEETGRSFSHHVLGWRLGRAVALLRDPQWHNRTISDIATEAGFSDVSYFNRSFRRQFGATPTDVRTAAIRDAALRE
jgi:AraC-like DNA-binding protein